MTDAPAAVKAVIFDLYATLIHEPHFEGIYQTLAAEIGVDLADYIPARQKTIVDAMVGRLPTAEARARAVLAGLGMTVTNGLAGRLATIERDHRWPRVRLYPATVPTLLALRQRGFPIGLISDCTGLMGWPILERLDLTPHFDAVALSYEVGYAKPAPEIYRVVVDRLGVPPSACLYVGDGGSNEIEGARSLGMVTARIDQEGAFARNGYSASADHVIVSLDEVLELLQVAPGRSAMPRLDVSWIREDLAIGSRIDPRNIPRLKLMGIDAIVDLRAEESDDPELLERNGLRFLHLPMTDCDPLTQEQMREGSAWIARQRANGRRVLVHCQHGVGRSVMLVAATLISEGLAPTTALDRIHSRRPQIALNAAQLAAVYEYGRLYGEAVGNLGK